MKANVSQYTDMTTHTAVCYVTLSRFTTSGREVLQSENLIFLVVSETLNIWNKFGPSKQTSQRNTVTEILHENIKHILA